MHNILIVDDEPTIRHSLKGVLEDEGYKTQSAESGEKYGDAANSHSRTPFRIPLPGAVDFGGWKAGGIIEVRRGASID